MTDHSLKPWYDMNYPEAWWPHHVVKLSYYYGAIFAKCCQEFLFFSKDHWNIELCKRRIFLLAPNRSSPLCISLNKGNEGHEDVSAYLHLSEFLCISMHFSAYLWISLHFSAFFWISLHLTECTVVLWTTFLSLNNKTGKGPIF